MSAKYIYTLWPADQPMWGEIEMGRRDATDRAIHLAADLQREVTIKRSVAGHPFSTASTLEVILPTEALEAEREVE